MASRLLSVGVAFLALLRFVTHVRGDPQPANWAETQLESIGSDEHNMEDVDFWVRFLQQGGSLSIMPTPSPTHHPTPNPTRVATSRPTNRLTAQPTSEPNNTPTAIPIQEPSDSPSQVPSNRPSSYPTKILPLSTSVPSFTPSTPPVTAAPITAAPVTPSPTTAQPTTGAPVTAAPVTKAPVTKAPITEAPVTAAPVTKPPVTQAPLTAAPVTKAPVTNSPVTASPTSSRPTPQPVIPTTPIPTRLPTPQPTSSCTIDVGLNCIVGGGFFGGQRCNSSTVGVTTCSGTLKALTMLYTGEKCSKGINRQNASCTDLSDDPLPIRAYIVVADNGGLATYFRDWVIIGSKYKILPVPGRPTFASMQRIQVYNSSNTVDANLAQEILYESDCAVPLGLTDQFGASQVVEFQTTQQGNVSSFVNFIFDVSLSLPSSFPDISTTLNRLIVISNALGNVNLTGSVNGKQLEPMKFINTTLAPVPIDLTTRQRYNTLATVAGVSLPGGLPCNGQAFSTFVAGGQPQ